MGLPPASEQPWPPAAFSVVIAGAGVAGLETAAALRTLAGDRVAITLVAPEQEFVYRPLTPHQSFQYLVAPHVPLTEVADRLGVRLVTDRLAWVDRDERTVHTRSGSELAFDALVLAVGAAARARYEHAVTVGDRSTAPLTQLVDELKAGQVTRVAFIVPERMAWPLPLYEVALMCAALSAEHDRGLQLTIVTAEWAPLQVFGESASAQMADLLSQQGVETMCAARAEVPAPGRVVISPIHPPARHTAPLSRELGVDRVVALPELFGPHVPGLPSAENGFLAVDAFCRVRGVAGIYAVGDATAYPVKHGGIAAQQADVAALSIAALAGAAVTPRPFHPTIDGVLVTGGQPRHLSARLIGGEPFASEFTALAADLTPAKIAARYLAWPLGQAR
jgi:sulfide:quinone oxidoreductase